MRFLSIYFLLNCLVLMPVVGQQSLSAEQFIDIVREYHPVIKQANILIDRAKAENISAKAGFDPTFYVETDQKTFDGKNYYNYVNPELKIPTWYGIEIKTGVEDNRGLFTSPETSLGQTSYLGISMPLAKNLMMDKRRAALKQAAVFQKMSQSERQLMRNDLLYEAYSVYWNWVKEYQTVQILNEAITINQDRYRFVKISYQQGERAALDTVEALTQLQNIQFQQNEALLKFKNASLELSNFLWVADNTPYQLPADVRPNADWQKANDLAFNLAELIQTAKLNHPKLKMYDFKLEGLEIERRLKYQSLLPTLNVRANLLSKGYNALSTLDNSTIRNNYKFGIDFGIPLRFSEGRGEYQKAKLKIKDTNFDLSLTRLEIENKVRAYYNEFENLKTQVVLYEATYKNFQTLFKGEEVRFRIGESTLFLINSRENKVLETAQKLVEIMTKRQKSQVAVRWAMGELATE